MSEIEKFTIVYELPAYQVDTEKLGAEWVGSLINVRRGGRAPVQSGRLLSATWGVPQYAGARPRGVIDLEYVEDLSQFDGGRVRLFVTPKAIVELLKSMEDIKI